MVLLHDLVDFSDYFDDIRFRVERATLVDSDLTLQDTYTPSRYRREKDSDVEPDSLEDFILAWLSERNRQQLALLGEYGQGKSTASLLLSYRLIEQTQEDADIRIPILIELRGKTLRTLTPRELLASWALHYSIDPQALLHLHMAGRLLLIFEGFDEIDLSGDTEARLSHFNTLWRLNYPQAKILVTGRPNFFLDSTELKRALGTAEQTRTLYLAPFNLEQIANSLRTVDERTCSEILTLARRDNKFREVVSRPSLLYIVAVLWQRKQLSQRQHIDSALVIDLFIRQSLRRQQDKHLQHPFMVLNSAERHYFMAGIAAYMASRGLPNQIDKYQLKTAVEELVAAIPDSVSLSVSTVRHEDARPLRSEERLDWQNRQTEIIDKIQTDVRSCGLLVTDWSRDGLFKFAHKSYMELLQAQVIAHLFASDSAELAWGRSIANTWNLKIDDLQGSDEAIGFLAELLKERLLEQGISEPPDIANGLWETLVIGKFSQRQSIRDFLLAGWVGAAGRLAGGLVHRFGIEKRRIIGLIFQSFIYIGILPVLIAIIGIAFKVAVVAGVEMETEMGAAVVAGMVVGTVAFLFLRFRVIREVEDKITTFLSVYTLVVLPPLLSFLVLIESDWPWLYTLLITILVALTSLAIGSITNLAMDLLLTQKTSIFKRLRLWYRACEDLTLPSNAIEKTVGQGVTLLLKAASERRER